MFTPAQLKEFKEIAECIDSAKIKFDRQKLLITTDYTTDEDYAIFSVVMFFAGVIICLVLVLSIIFKEWGLFGFSIVGLLGLIIGWRKMMRNREKNSNRLPNLVFDNSAQSFFVLNTLRGSKQAPFYDQYSANVVVGVRALILSSSEYSDDAIVQICLGEDKWITVLKANRGATAYHLENIIASCRKISLG